MKTTSYNYYDVMVKYEGNIPVFHDRVYATSHEHAAQLATYNAMNKGWPTPCKSVVASRLID